jgi:hypothetical protein
VYSVNRIVVLKIVAIKIPVSTVKNPVEDVELRIATRGASQKKTCISFCCHMPIIQYVPTMKPMNIISWVNSNGRRRVSINDTRAEFSINSLYNPISSCASLLTILPAIIPRISAEH